MQQSPLRRIRVNNKAGTEVRQVLPMFVEEWGDRAIRLARCSNMSQPVLLVLPFSAKVGSGFASRIWDDVDGLIGKSLVRLAWFVKPRIVLGARTYEMVCGRDELPRFLSALVRALHGRGLHQGAVFVLDVEDLLVRKVVFS